jgi:hypothetical protein
MAKAKIFLRQVTAQKQMRKIKVDQPATWFSGLE